MWYNALSETQKEFERCWQPGDIIGSLLGTLILDTLPPESLSFNSTV